MWVKFSLYKILPQLSSLDYWAASERKLLTGVRKKSVISPVGVMTGSAGGGAGGFRGGGGNSLRGLGEGGGEGARGLGGGGGGR